MGVITQYEQCGRSIINPDVMKYFPKRVKDLAIIREIDGRPVMESDVKVGSTVAFEGMTKSFTVKTCKFQDVAALIMIHKKDPTFNIIAMDLNDAI